MQEKKCENFHDAEFILHYMLSVDYRHWVCTCNSYGQCKHTTTRVLRNDCSSGSSILPLPLSTSFCTCWVRAMRYSFYDVQHAIATITHKRKRHRYVIVVSNGAHKSRQCYSLVTLVANGITGWPIQFQSKISHNHTNNNIRSWRSMAVICNEVIKTLLWWSTWIKNRYTQITVSQWNRLNGKRCAQEPWQQRNFRL